MNNRRRQINTSRYNQAVQTREKDQNVVKRALAWQKLKSMPDFCKPKLDEKYTIDIVPFEIKSKNHPLVAKGLAKIGDLDFMLDIWEHRYIGANKEAFVCPKKNYGDGCPVCDEADRLWNDGEESSARQLFASRRCYFNIKQVVNNEHGDLQVFDTSHHLFGKALMSEAHAEAVDGQPQPFADLDNGSSIYFRTEKGDWGKTAVTYAGLRFRSRRNPITDNDVDNAISFDELITVLPYAEIEALMNGEAPGQETVQKEAPRRNPRVKEPEAEQEPKPKVQEFHSTKDEIMEEAEDLPFDTDLEVDFEDKKPKEVNNKSLVKCPAKGGVFGEDLDKHDECLRCEYWEKCADASNA